MRRGKVKLTLSAAKHEFPRIGLLFYDVHLFDDITDTASLASLFIYLYGSRVLNYDFTLTSSGVDIGTQDVQNLQNLVNMYTAIWLNKYRKELNLQSTEYNPIWNTNLQMGNERTKTPNLTETHGGTDTRTDTKDLQTEDETTYGKGTSQQLTRNTTDTTSATTNFGETISKEESTDYGKTVTGSDSVTYGETITGSNSTTHGESIAKSETDTYGKVTNHATTNDTTTNSVSPFDAPSTYNGANKSEHTDTSSDTNSGQDTKTATETHSGTDRVQSTEEHTGTDKATKSETLGGTDETNKSEKHGGSNTQSGSLIKTGTETTTGSTSGKDTRTLAQTGTDTRATQYNSTIRTTGNETTADDGYQRGYKPFAGAPTIQHAIEKERAVWDYSVVYNYLQTIADYLLLSYWGDADKEINWLDHLNWD